ncbi:MAG: MEDS domain-containing protein [Thaumarchaeota archaeon]|nr:MEDS domain-containing protein [Nitrososphaerota archaeon]
MLDQGIVESIREMESGTHAVLIYDTQEHKREVLLRHLREGVGREGLVYAYYGIDEVSLAEQMKGAGIDVELLQAAGDLTIKPSEEVYLKGGVMDVGGVIRGFADLAYGYRRNGKEGIRAGADMSPILKADRGPDVVAYEERLGRKFTFPGKGICAYDLIALHNSGELQHLMPIFMAHAMVILAGPGGYAVRRPDEVERDGLAGVLRHVIPTRSDDSRRPAGFRLTSSR